VCRDAEPIWDEYLKNNNIVKLNKERYFTPVIVDEDDRTPIHYAASRNSAKALRTLLASKESYDVVNNKTKRGETALHMAAKNGYLECLTLLLAAKADITIQDKERGWNALHFVTSSGNAQCLGLILKGKFTALCKTAILTFLPL
jgi:ankyrin repeat protein